MRDGQGLIIIITGALFFCAGTIMIWAIGSVIAGEQPDHRQYVFIKGKKYQINDGGCVNASDNCNFYELAGQAPTSDCLRFCKNTGYRVQDWCKKHLEARGQGAERR